MKAKKHERYTISFEPDEAMHVASIVSKIARPAPGFAKGPAFSTEEREVLDALDDIFNPVRDDEE